MRLLGKPPSLPLNARAALPFRNRRRKVSGNHGATYTLSPLHTGSCYGAGTARARYPPLTRYKWPSRGLDSDQCGPLQMGLTFDGCEMLMGRYTMILQPISSINVLLAAVALLGCGAPHTKFGGFSPPNRETSGEASSTTGVIPVVEQASLAVQVHSLQGPSPSSKSLRAKPRTVPGPNSQASTLPRPGTPIFGSRGFTGTVTSSHGRHATVAPTGGGAPGILIPRSRSTGTLFLPGRPPVTVIMHP